MVKSKCENAALKVNKHDEMEQHLLDISAEKQLS